MQMTLHLFRSMIRDKIQDRIYLYNFMCIDIYFIHVCMFYLKCVFFIVKLKIEFCCEFRRAIYRSFKVGFNKYYDIKYDTHAH